VTVAAVFRGMCEITLNDFRPPLPPPWTVEEYRGISYIVRDANGQALSYVYDENEMGRACRCGLAVVGRGTSDRSQYRRAGGATKQRRLGGMWSAKGAVRHAVVALLR
jgi:hypothetical protein